RRARQNKVADRQWTQKRQRRTTSERMAARCPVERELRARVGRGRMRPAGSEKWSPGRDGTIPCDVAAKRSPVSGGRWRWQRLGPEPRQQAVEVVRRRYFRGLDTTDLHAGLRHFPAQVGKDRPRPAAVSEPGPAGGRQRAQCRFERGGAFRT